MNHRHLILHLLSLFLLFPALPAAAQTVINLPLEQYQPLSVVAENMEVELPAEGITLGSQLAVTGGDGRYTFAWTSAQTGATILGTTSTLLVTAPGTYFLVVTDGHACRVSTQFTVNAPAAVNAAQAPILRQRIFDLSGHLIQNIHGTALPATLPAGVYLLCTQHTDGTTRLRKITIHP